MPDDRPLVGVLVQVPRLDAPGVVVEDTGNGLRLIRGRFAGFAGRVGLRAGVLVGVCLGLTNDVLVDAPACSGVLVRDLAVASLVPGGDIAKGVIRHRQRVFVVPVAAFLVAVPALAHVGVGGDRFSRASLWMPSPRRCSAQSASAPTGPSQSPRSARAGRGASPGRLRWALRSSRERGVQARHPVIERAPQMRGWFGFPNIPADSLQPGCAWSRRSARTASASRASHPCPPRSAGGDRESTRTVPVQRPARMAAIPRPMRGTPHASQSTWLFLAESFREQPT